MIHLKSPITFALALTLGTALSFANDDGKGMGPHGDPHKMAAKMADKIITELKLTDGQATKVKAVFNDGADQMEQMQKDQPMEKMHGDFMKQITATTVDTAAMNKEFNERQSRMAERHAIMQQHLVELHDILTPDQRTQLAAIMQKQHDEMMKKWKDHKDDKGMKGKGEDE